MTDEAISQPAVSNDLVDHQVSELPATTQTTPAKTLAPQPPSATASTNDALSVRTTMTTKNPNSSPPTVVPVNGKAPEVTRRKAGVNEKWEGGQGRPPGATNEWGEEDGEFEIDEDTAASNAAAAAAAAATATAATQNQNGETVVVPAETATPAASTEAQTQLIDLAQSSTMETPQKKRRGRPPGSGRKRKLAEVDAEPADDQEWKPQKDEMAEGGASEHDHDGGEDDDEGKTTKFGRKVQKPSQYNPILHSPGNSGTKRPYQRRVSGVHAGGTIVCTVCHRGHSPKSNRIVLCDNCDRPYHQQCHNPVVEDLIVTLPDAKWYCAQCERGRKKKKIETEITGVGIGLDQKKAYLLSLPKSSLVDLALFAEKYHPDLRLYPAYLKTDAEAPAAVSSAVSFVVPTTITSGPADFTIALKIPLTKNAADGDADADADAEGELTAGSPLEITSSRDFERLEVDGVPSYEDMIAKAIIAIADPNGTQPKDIWDWMSSNYPLAENFSRSASQSLLKAVKKGRFIKESGLYKLNPVYVPDPTKLKRGARKPSFVKSDGTVVTPSKKPIGPPRKKSKESPADDVRKKAENNEANYNRKEEGKISDEIPESGIELDFREGASSQIHQQLESTVVTATTESVASEEEVNILLGKNIPAAAALPSIAHVTLAQPDTSRDLNGAPAATPPPGPNSHIASFATSSNVSSGHPQGQKPQHFNGSAPFPASTDTYTAADTWNQNYSHAQDVQNTPYDLGPVIGQPAQEVGQGHAGSESQPMDMS